MTQAIASPAVHDLIGIGFGPSNLALAIALQEREKAQGKLDVLFLDKQADYRWHGIPPGISNLPGDPPKEEQAHIALKELRTLRGKIESEHE